MQNGVDTQNMKNRTIVLDFDGVVCDGLNECLLSVWNTWHGLDVDAFTPATLDEVPLPFAERFAHFRNFVRHSGHFVMPFLSAADTFSCGEDFEAEFGRIPTAKVDAFLKRFEEYRTDVIRHRYEAWIGMHSYYDGVLNVFANPFNTIFIVSGKDTRSIKQILMAKEVSIPEDRIFGSQKNKIPALRKIALATGLDHASIKFYDDNLPNVLEAKEHGFQAIWAGWGYRTARDLDLSVTHNIQPTELNRFVTDFS
jgi:phosphoglycolate phosphatase-like HAD superfamily hydrolase